MVWKGQAKGKQQNNGKNILKGKRRLLATGPQQEPEVNTPTVNANSNVMKSLRKRDRPTEELQQVGDVSVGATEASSVLNNAERERKDTSAADGDTTHPNLLSDGQEVSLKGTKVDKNTLQPLQASVTLRKLSVTVKEEDVDVQQLTSLKMLKDLCIEYVSGKILNVTSLKELSHMERLCFKGSCIEELEELTLNGCEELKKIEGIHLLPNLTILNLGRTSTNDDFLKELSVCKKLSKLTLSGCPGLENVEQLSNFATLKELSLSWCSNIIHGWEGIGQLPQLRVLHLEGNKITNRTLEPISKSKSLVSLDVSFCEKLTDATPLCRVKTLEELNLHATKITSGIDNLVLLPRLRVLDVRQLQLSAFDTILSAFAAVRYGIRLSSFCNGFDIESISSIQTLEELSVGGLLCAAIQFGSIGGLPRLRVLRLSSKTMFDESLKGISHSRSLVAFDLSGCSCLEDISSISGIKTLEALSLRDCTNVSDGWIALGELPLLRILDLSCTKIQDVMLRVLFPKLKLDCLSLAGCENITHIGPLINVKSLKNLVLEECSELKAGFEALLELPLLTWVDLCYVNDNKTVKDTLVARGVDMRSVWSIIGNCTSLFDWWRAK